MNIYTSCILPNVTCQYSHPQLPFTIQYLLCNVFPSHLSVSSSEPLKHRTKEVLYFSFYDDWYVHVPGSNDVPETWMI